MNQQFSHVLSPIRVNGTLFKNRIIVAPITPTPPAMASSIPTRTP